MIYDVKDTDNKLIMIVSQAETLPRVGDYISLEDAPEDMYRVLGVKHFVMDRPNRNYNLPVHNASRPVVCVLKENDQRTFSDVTNSYCG